MIARPATLPGAFANAAAASRIIGQYQRPWADLARHYQRPMADLVVRHFGTTHSSVLWKSEAMRSVLVLARPEMQAFQAGALKSVLAVTRPELPKLQTAALKIMQPELAKFAKSAELATLTKSAVASQLLAQHPVRLPPGYLDQLFKFSEVASLTNLIKTLNLQMKTDLFSQVASWSSAHPGLFDRLDVSFSEDGLSESDIEAGTAAIMRTQPALSRGAAQVLFIGWFYVLLAYCVGYVMITYPKLAPPILAALGCTTKDAIHLCGKLFDKLDPPGGID
jgi:hypothetical protein